MLKVGNVLHFRQRERPARRGQHPAFVGQQLHRVSVGAADEKAAGLPKPFFAFPDEQRIMGTGHGPGNCERVAVCGRHTGNLTNGLQDAFPVHAHRQGPLRRDRIIGTNPVNKRASHIAVGVRVFVLLVSVEGRH
ncbi:hypothetical protein SDC9_209986 [bioreactor metagenome]|uniref:Uncharacterized protein n=1 Tax=bioreactor metagenome TaxID=1076179 RepID=A0A645JHR6_9ZZZZ